MRMVRKALILLIFFCLLVKNISLYAYAEEIGLYMGVEEPEQKTASFSVGQQHRWFIRIKLSGDWDGVTILQTLSPALTLDAGTVGLRLVRENGEQILLRMEEQYLLTAGSVFVEEGTADRFCITLTREGMDFLSEYMTQSWELVVSYTAKINASAAMGSQILGTAQMNLTDTNGKKYIFLSDKAVASTGGIHILLTDPEGKPLEGSSFMLAREATREELEDDTCFKEILDTGNETIAVIYERFYTSGDMRGEKCDIAVTDGEGEALCYGLAYGTYYLVQTESGQENILPSKPIRVEINEASHITPEDGWTDSLGRIVDSTVRVTGGKMVMPDTGGPGTVPYTVSGTVVILSACLLLWYNRKQKILV